MPNNSLLRLVGKLAQGRIPQAVTWAVRSGLARADKIQLPSDEPSSAQDGHFFVSGPAGPMGKQGLRVLWTPPDPSPSLG